MPLSLRTTSCSLVSGLGRCLRFSKLLITFSVWQSFKDVHACYVGVR